MAKKKVSGIPEFSYTTDAEAGGAKFTVAVSVKDGLIGYSVLRNGVPASWMEQPPERFASEAEAQEAMFEYGTSEDMRHQLERIEIRIQSIEELLSKRRGREYATEAELLEQVVDSLFDVLESMR
jgi:hypothetical protein